MPIGPVEIADISGRIVAVRIRGTRAMSTYTIVLSDHPEWTQPAAWKAAAVSIFVAACLRHGTVAALPLLLHERDDPDAIPPPKS